MRRARLGRVPLIALVLCVVGSIAAPAFAQGGPVPPDAAIAGPDGHVVGAGVHDPTGLDQRVSFTVVSGRTRPARLVIENPGEEQQTFVLHGSAGGRVFQVAYRVGGADVTSRVAAGGYSLTLEPGSARTVTLGVRAVPTSKAGQHGGFRFSVTNAADPDLADVARAQVEVAPVTTSSLSPNGHLRCVAMFESRTLHPGFKTHVEMEFRNLTAKPLQTYGFGYLEFEDAMGTEIGRSAIPPRWPPFLREVPPHGSLSVFVIDAVVRWAGPLRVRPECPGTRPMRPARLVVSAPGSPAGTEAAIDAAVAVPNSPFQACHPGPNGEPVKGTFQAPDGRQAPPLRFRCWAEVTHQPGFDVVALNMVSPWNAPATTLDDNHIEFVDLPGHGNAIAARWGFVVTSTRVRPYVALGASRGVGEGKAHSYLLHEGAWKNGGWTRCGFWGFFESFYGDDFFLDWVSECHRATGMHRSTVIGGAGRARSMGAAGQVVHGRLERDRRRAG